MSTVVILDFGMDDKGGHHVRLARSVLARLQMPKSEILLMTNAGVTQDSLDGVTIKPVFSATGYEFSSVVLRPPMVREIKAVTSSMALELLRVDGVLRQAQQIYVLNANALILRALAEWLTIRRKRLDARLHIHVMYNLGVALKRYGPRWSPVQVNETWRLIATDAHKGIRGACSAVTYLVDSKQRQRELRYMFGETARLLPAPSLRDQGKGQPLALPSPFICFGVGDAKVQKGFLETPDVVAHCLEQHPDFGVALHANGAQDTHAKTHQRLRDLSAANPRFMFWDSFLPESEYYAVLGGADLLVLPYLKESYFAQSSWVLADALRLGVPCAVPAYTELWDVGQSTEGGVVFPFRTNSTDSILKAVAAGVDHLSAAKQPPRGVGGVLRRALTRVFTGGA